MTLQLGLGPEVEKLLEGIKPTEWYPLSLYERMNALVTSAYATPGPIFEKMGIEASRLTFEGEQSFRGMRGADFLRFYVASYASYVRGPANVVGAIELVLMSEEDGHAIVRTTSIVPRDLERGFYYGGLQSLDDVAFVNIVTDYAGGMHHIEFH